MLASPIGESGGNAEWPSSGSFEKTNTVVIGETILRDGQTVSLVTSQGYGYSVEKMIMRGYLPEACCKGANFTVEVFGEPHDITRVDGPLYDPQNKRLKS